LEFLKLDGGSLHAFPDIGPSPAFIKMVFYSRS
jgi:hypothetical protein